MSTETVSHPEHACERCSGSNVCWFAPNEIWNAAHGPYDILCPLCFITLAEAVGFRKDAWRIVPEFYEGSGQPEFVART